MEKEPKLMPTAYFVIILVLSITFHFIFPIKKIIYLPYNLFGIILIIFGFIINIWTDSLFKRHETTVKPHKAPRALIIKGPFLISRHPMYLGMLAVLLGIAILLGSLITFIFPVLFVILMEILFIKMEERILEREFRDKYREYKSKVRRWI